MKILISFFFVWLCCLSVVCGQSPKVDSVRRAMAKNRLDTTQVQLMIEEASGYRFNRPDSATILARAAIQLSRQLKYPKGEIQALNILGEALHYQGELPQALEAQFNALQISRKNNALEEQANSLTFIGIIYVEMSVFQQGLTYLQLARKLHEQLTENATDRIDEFSGKTMSSFTMSWIGEVYERMNRLDSSLHFQKKAYNLSLEVESKNLRTLILTRLGIAEARLGHDEQAISYYRKAHQNAIVTNDILNQSRIEYHIAALYQESEPDSSMYYAQQAYINGRRVLEQKIILDASSLLVRHYQLRRQPDSALYYQQVSMAAKDSLFGPEKFHRLQLLTLSEQQRQQQLREAQAQAQARFQRTSLLSVLGFFLFVAILLWRNNRQQQRNNQLLSEKNLQIEAQRNTLEKTVQELNTTQSQLVQREKMAALGELTAGIAHEIQNPLNFVNNFSEVSIELIEESREELALGKIEEAKAISQDIKQNLEKIMHHGKRADSIVKSMLQHSRTSSGEKQATDINALVEEYLRLAYHGLRAKEKDFNADYTLEADPAVGNIELVPQEIGRVLLNLFNNAFYATQQKKTQLNGQYQPQVLVSTKSIGNKVEITVRDNGTGIPENVRHKIFQPFFTTKPTGEGTGLGLSLSYDIITKGHGGELKVDSKEEEYTTMVILLPVQP